MAQLPSDFLGFIVLVVLHHSIVAETFIVHTVHLLVLFLFTCRTFCFHITETVCQCSTEAASSVAVLGVASEEFVACYIVPAAAVEKVACVEA